MMRIEDLLMDLIDALATPHAASAHVAIAVTDFDLDVPVEARMAADGGLLMTLPRGQLATGFERPLGRLRLHCEEAPR
jgi:hypothetical protein